MWRRPFVWGATPADQAPWFARRKFALLKGHKTYWSALGFDIAKGVAQHLVVYHRRHGGQSQFAASVDLAPKNNRISAALGYARDHIAEALTLENLAEAVGMSRRQFSRAFRAQTGTTPARVVERLRADMARGRIESTAEPVERIAEAVGFGDAENMRRAFIRIYGQPPQSIRRAIRI
jgi:transcriptional regulator GlxA family with amidase domain